MILDFRTLVSLLAGLVLCCAASGCASNPAANSRGLTGSVDKPLDQSARAEEDEEPVRPVPPDPYRGVQYKGGRDPVTGAAPNLDGQLPPPPVVAAPARKNATRTAVAIAASPATAKAATASDLSIQVQPGDTLTSIARKYQVTVAALMQVNGLATPKIMAAQTLIIPAK